MAEVYLENGKEYLHPNEVSKCLGINSEAVSALVENKELTPLWDSGIRYISVASIVIYATKTGIPEATITQFVSDKYTPWIKARKPHTPGAIQWAPSVAGKCPRCISKSNLLRGECINCGWGPEHPKKVLWR